MKPRTEAIAYRIWAYCTPREWDCTIPEIAEALDVPSMQVMVALRVKGWLHRVRRVSAYAFSRYTLHSSGDAFADDHGIRFL